MRAVSKRQGPGTGRIDEIEEHGPALQRRQRNLLPVLVDQHDVGQAIRSAPDGETARFVEVASTLATTGCSDGNHKCDCQSRAAAAAARHCNAKRTHHFHHKLKVVAEDGLDCIWGGQLVAIVMLKDRELDVGIEAQYSYLYLAAGRQE